MLRTEILGNGGSYQATSYGAINVNYHGDTAEITIKYFGKDDQFQMVEEGYRETKAILTVCTLDQLRQDDIFKDQLYYTRTFHFEHSWTLSFKDNQLVVYAGESELAFKLITSNQGVLDVLQKMSGAGICSNLPFFREQVQSEKLKFVNQYGSGSSGHFFYQHDEAGLTIKNGSSKCEIKCEKLSHDSSEQWCRSINNLKKISYLHQWFEFNFESNDQQVNNKINRMYFSPDLKMCIKESYDLFFPYEELIKSHHNILVFIPMYYEMAVETDMKKHHCSFEKMRLLVGMNEEKLGMITYHYSKIRQLHAHGITMEELARCDESRLSMVMINFSEIENKLKTVNLREILGLNSQLSTLYYSTNQLFSPTLFGQASRLVTMSEEISISDDNDCDIETENPCEEGMDGDSCDGRETDSDSDSELSMDDGGRKRPCYIS